MAYHFKSVRVLMSVFSEKTPSPLKAYGYSHIIPIYHLPLTSLICFFSGRRWQNGKIICPYGRWLRSGGVSERRINQYCAEGRIPGAHRFGKSWAIPENAQSQRIRGMPGALQKPEIPYLARYSQRVYISSSRRTDKPNSRRAVLIPERNPEGFGPYKPHAPDEHGIYTGQVQRGCRSHGGRAQKDIAMAEYHYFSGQPEKAAKKQSPYLTSTDMGARLSACLLYTYANLSIGQISNARFALGELNASIAAAGRRSPQFKAASAFVASAGAVLLHLPLPDQMPEAGNSCRCFRRDSGLCHVCSGPLYVFKGEYAHSAGTVENPPLAMGASFILYQPYICTWWQ